MKRAYTSSETRLRNGGPYVGWITIESNKLIARGYVCESLLYGTRTVAVLHSGDPQHDLRSRKHHRSLPFRVSSYARKSSLDIALCRRRKSHDIGPGTHIYVTTPTWTSSG